MDPAIKKSVWTEDEEKLLKLYHGQYGNKWTRLSELIIGRRYASKIEHNLDISNSSILSENDIKNHWNSIARREKDSGDRSALAIPTNSDKRKG